MVLLIASPYKGNRHAIKPVSKGVVALRVIPGFTVTVRVTVIVRAIVTVQATVVVRTTVTVSVTFGTRLGYAHIAFVVHVASLDRALLVLAGLLRLRAGFKSLARISVQRLLFVISMCLNGDACSICKTSYIVVVT